MRVESCVTSLSWIPSEAIAGLAKLPFRSGLAHFDVAPPSLQEIFVALVERASK